MSSDALPYPVRAITDAEVADFNALLDLAFHEMLAQEAHDLWMAVLPNERTVAAFDGEEMISTGGDIPFELTVPGGRTVPTAGVTMISVKATHRRRGVLSSVMRHQMRGWHERGAEPVAMLFASEPAIYGRFGYALGTECLTLSIPRGDKGLSAVAGSDKFRMRLVEPRQAFDRCLAVYEANRPIRPGMLSRTGAAWRALRTSDNESMRHGAGVLRCAVAEDADGTAAGFAWYRVKDGGGDPARPGTRVEVKEVYGRDLASYAAVWRFLLDIDLTDQINVDVPTDDPLLYLLADPRQALPKLRDRAYVRLVDVDRALAARRYSAPIDVVFEVSDPFCPWNTGRWRLRGDADGAMCEATTDPADLLLGPRELSSAYLGGIPLVALGRAGRIEELRPGALAAASRAFVSEVAPFVPFGF